MVLLLLADVAAASTAVAAVPARTAKIAALAELLGRAGAGDVAAVVSWLSGELTQRQIGVGYATSTSSQYRSYWTQDFGTPR